MDNLLFNVGIENLFTVFDLHEFACEWKEFVAPMRVTYVKMHGTVHSDFGYVVGIKESRIFLLLRV